jgi:hypothetical protein
VFAFARFDLMLPTTHSGVGCRIFNAGTGIMVYRTMRKVTSETAAIVTALLWLFTLLPFREYLAAGMESTISAFFIAFLFNRLLIMFRLRRKLAPAD